MKKVFLSVLAMVAACNLMAVGVDVHYGIEAGYAYNYMRFKTDMPDFTQKDIDEATQEYKFHGFEVGGLVDLDFTGAMPANHIIGLQTGLKYTFGDYNYYMQDEKMKEDRKKLYEHAKEEGISKIRLTDDNFMHALSIPIRFKYTYQINNAWAVSAFTGPELRFNLALQRIETSYYKEEDYEGLTIHKLDYVSGYSYYKDIVNGEKEEEKLEFEKEEKEYICIPLFDLGWGFGLGASWNNISLNVRYDLGLLNINPAGPVKLAKEAGYKVSMNRDAIAVTLAYRFK